MMDKTCAWIEIICDADSRGKIKNIADELKSIPLEAALMDYQAYYEWRNLVTKGV